MSNALASSLVFALDAVRWIKEVLRAPCDDTQADIIRAVSKRVLLCCHRQYGKSTITAFRTAHRMIYRPGHFTVCIAPSARQSAELVRKIDAALQRADMRTKGDGDNEISLILPNGSRFVGLPDTEGRSRGFGGVHDLIIEEASRVKDETYLAARPFVASVDGTITLLSTPFGKRGFFHRAASEGEWVRYVMPATRSGRLSESFLKDEEQALGRMWFAQEYLCEFLAVNEQLFSPDSVLDSIATDVGGLQL